MSDRILIRAGEVFDPVSGELAHVDVLFESGVVAGVMADLPAEGAQVVDAAGLLVLPGLIDLHAHLREPGFEHKGTIATETEAALRGGFTTVCAMPNTDPAPDDAATVDALVDRIRRDARVNVLPVGCITSERAGKRPAEISELAAAGCVALSDDGDPVTDARLFRNALSLAAAAGLVVSEHSDDPALSKDGVVHEGAVGERLGLAGQPTAAEAHAVARNIELAAATGARLHIAHVSAARTVELVAEAKARGLPITCEVTPSHLFLTEDAVAGNGPLPAFDTNARVNPPLRSEADRRALIAGVNSGVIDAIATDHAPHAAEDKLCEFDRAAPGISCFETALATIMTLVDRGELERGAALRAMTLGPARCFSIDARVPGAGSLNPGQSSDAVVVDPRAAWMVVPELFASKGKNTPLAGMTLTGHVRAIVHRGEVHQFEEVASV